MINTKTDLVHKGNGRIVIMDDEEVIQETFKSMLEVFGYSAICKKDGKEVLDFFMEEMKAKHDIAGLILDLTIPGGMGGEDTAKEIRKLNLEIPIFVVSGYADNPIMKEPKKYGFTASLGKPFRKIELAEMLEKYMKKI
jgi:FixJ family two-component response regulator